MTEPRYVTPEQLLQLNQRAIAWCRGEIARTDAEAQRLAAYLDELTVRRAQLLVGVIRD